MGFFGDILGGIFDVVSSVVEGVIDVVGKAVEFAMDNPWLIAAAGIGFAAAGGSLGSMFSSLKTGAGNLFSTLTGQGATVIGEVGGSGLGIIGGDLGLATANAASGTFGVMAPTAAASTVPFAAGVAPAVAETAGGGFLSSVVDAGKGLLKWGQDNPLLSSVALQTVSGGLQGLQAENMAEDQRAFELDYLDQKYNKEYQTAVDLENEKRRMEDEEQQQAYGGILDINGATGQSDQDLIADSGILTYQQRFGDEAIVDQSAIQNLYGTGAA